MSNLISKAQIYCISKHGFQKRKYTGEPYSDHPIRVAGLAMEAPYESKKHLIYTDEKNTLYKSLTQDGLIAIALLHDVIEDTPTTYEELVAVFDKTVADGVRDLTNESKLTKSTASRAERKRMDREKIKSCPPYIRFIKYLDRLDNLTDTLHYVLDWNIRHKLPEKDFFFKYIEESRELQDVLNLKELSETYGNDFFWKYNLNYLMTNLEQEVRACQ